MMRKLGITLLIILVIHQNCFHFRVKASDGFIRTRGIQFSLNGYPFYANGFNAYWLMYMASDPSQRHRVSDAFREASSHGLTLARTWAFSDGGYKPLQYAPGSYNEDMFKGLDFVIAEAKKYGMKVILSLANNYDSFGGKKQYVEWARKQGQPLSSEDDFFRNSLVKAYYKNHIKTVLNRKNTLTGVVYKNDPTIMAWELMNEPRCTSDPSGSTIQSWIEEMAKYLKSIDTNHLVEAGLEGFYGQSSPRSNNLNLSLNVGTDFISNNRISAIDFATTHVYPDQWLSSSNDEAQRAFLDSWLDSHIRDSQIALRKPLLVSEFGKSRKDAAFTSDQRDALYNAVFYKIYYSAKRGGAAAGGLFWQLFAEGMENFGDGYEIVLSRRSPTANLIAQQAHKLGQIRKILARMTEARRRRRQRGGASGRGKGKRIGN